jgi:hypothetical protein
MVSEAPPALIRERRMVTLAIEEVNFVTIHCGLDQSTVCGMVHLPFDSEDSPVEYILVLRMAKLLFPRDE